MVIKNKCLKCDIIFSYRIKINNDWKILNKRKFCTNCVPYKNKSTNKDYGNCLVCDKKLKKSSIKYCSYKCQKENQYNNYIKKWLNGEISGTSGKYGISDTIRNYFFIKHNNSCSKCGWSKINPKTNKIPLHINHIDGNYQNNKENNLELLCPNCHSLTLNYGVLNRGNGRPYTRVVFKNTL